MLNNRGVAGWAFMNNESVIIKTPTKINDSIKKWMKARDIQQKA